MSDFLKIHKAVKNDDDFRARVEIASSLEGFEFSEDILIKVAHAVVNHISLSDSGIDTSAVSDREILDALKILDAVESEGEGEQE